MVETTTVPFEFTLGAKSVTVLARHVLRIDARQAHGRVKAAEALGPRLTLTGEPLDPIYRQVAAAQARGSVCEAAARVIVDMVDRLPGEIAAAKGAEVEAFLVEQAEQLDVDCIRKIAHRMSATLDPDGRFKDIAYRERHRDLRLILRPDGSGHLDGELTAECAEHLATTFDALARPRPETDGVKDPRTAGQRRHDALVDAVKLLERAEALPHTAGVSATIVLTMTAGAYRTGAGTATSGHGAIVPASEAIRWAGDTRVVGVVLGSMKQVNAYSSAHRIFTEGQRLAMIVRDNGCSFPGCDAPPLWTEAHHVTDYAQTGRTTVDDGTLVCGFHHREHQRMGWTCRMIDRSPYWIPPRWLDPAQAPRRNHAHVA